MKGYHALIKTERWKKNAGADFVFFDPHPGFTDGTSDKDFKTFMCHTSSKSMHIVVERGQINICPVRVPCLPDLQLWACKLSWFCNLLRGPSDYISLLK